LTDYKAFDIFETKSTVKLEIVEEE